MPATMSSKAGSKVAGNLHLDLNLNNLDLENVGYGIEQECWIVNPATGKPVAEINGVSSYLAISQLMSDLDGFKDPEISAELLSCQLELKTPVLGSPKEAIEYIKDKMAYINDRIKCLGVQFETVGHKNMGGVPLLAADPNAASYDRVQEWSKTPEGVELLRSTAICSTQLCVSAGLESYSPEQKLKILSSCYKYLSDNYLYLQQINNNSPRLEIVDHLIITVKKDNFSKAGLIGGSTGRDETWITRPDGSNLLDWYMAHSGVLELDKINDKDAHGLLVKGKLAPMQATDKIPDLVCIEHRWPDAKPNLTDSLAKILEVHENMIDFSLSSLLDNVW